MRIFLRQDKSTLEVSKAIFHTHIIRYCYRFTTDIPIQLIFVYVLHNICYGVEYDNIAESYARQRDVNMLIFN